jgi:hypothetical protein
MHGSRINIAQQGQGAQQLSAASFGRGLRRQLHVLSTSSAPPHGRPAAHPSDLRPRTFCDYFSMPDALAVAASVVASIGWADQTT